MNLLLIGPRASGKTTIGRRLAARLNLPFIDLDDRALAHLGMNSVREVWEKLGETAWRDAEAKALEDTLREDGQVIALGGGVPMIANANAIIQAQRRAGNARVAYLRCSVDTLRERLSKNPGDRPSLTGAAVEDEVRAILNQREPTYRELADLEINVEHHSPKQLVEELAAWVRTKYAGAFGQR